MLHKTLTISDKGQIVIPKEFIEHLGSKMIKLEIGNNSQVKITPLKDVAGCLTNFAKKPTSRNFNEIRNQAWEKATLEKFGRA